MFIYIFLGSCLLYLTFPNRFFLFGCWPLGWIALSFLFPAIEKIKFPKRLWAGSVFGLVFYGLLVVWFIPYSFLGYIVFVFALAVQPVLFFGLYGLKPHKHHLDLVFVPALWIATEFVRALLLSGFSWNLGCSQAFQPLAIQTAALWGSSGVSFFLVLFNYSLYKWMGSKTHKRVYLAVLLMIMAVVFGFGIFSLHSDSKGSTPGGPLRIVAVQSNINFKQKEDKAFFAAIVAKQIALTESGAEGFAPDLIIWPETAVPADIRRDPFAYETVRHLAEDLNSHILIGSALNENGRNYNSAVLFSPEGKEAQVYHKKYLVPFSEYLPAGFLWEKLRSLMRIRSYDFTPGKKTGVFPLSRSREGRDAPGQDIKFGVGICCEDTIGALFQQFKKKDAGFAVILSNDGWFNYTEALVLHAQCAVMHAVENRMPVVRVTNTGWTCQIDSTGRIRGPGLPFNRAAAGKILVYPRQGKTFYHLIRDSFCFLSLGFVIIQMINRLIELCKKNIKKSNGVFP